MLFIQRDGAGKIVCSYANPQPGIAEEGIAEDAPEYLAFLESLAAGVAPTVIYKADIWRRATDAEAATIDAQLNAQPIRLRRMWQDSQTLTTSDEMYSAVKAAFESAFGTERAADLLAPTA